MRKYALDTTMLPQVWVTWATTKDGQFNGRYWLNCQTGKKENVPEPWMYYDGECSIGRYREPYSCGVSWNTVKNDKIWVPSNSRLYYVYAKYHKDIDRLEVAAVKMDTSRKEITRTWEYAGDRFFIAKDKSIINQNGVPQVRSMFAYKNHTAYCGKDLLSMLLRMNHNDHIISEFKKFIGGDYFTIGNGSSQKIEYRWHISRWYETVQKTRSAGKQQKLADELVKMPLTDASGFATKYQPIPNNEDSYWRSYDIDGIVYFERLVDGWCVLRSFIRNKDGSLREEWRMYINDDGRNRIISESNGDWVPSNQVRNNWRNHSYIVNKDDAMANCNRIKYILAADDKVEMTKEVDFLVTALRFPEIEQLIKLGHRKAAHDIAFCSTPKAYIKEKFGGYFNDKEKTLLRKIGMTKHQFDEYMSSDANNSGYYNESRRALETMRKMFGNDLSSMDNASFDKYFEALRTMSRSFHGKIERYMGYLNLDMMRFFKNLVRLGEKNRAVYGLANDTIDDYIALSVGTEPDVDWYFDSYSDLVRIHDAVTELKRMQDAERRAYWSIAEKERLAKEEKKREELDEQRKVYEYEDDKYIIRLPKTLSEIVNEGSAQRICIGGYTSRHARGETNIFFIREKSAESVPFYAIEMSNSKNIVQIHGYCNQWLGNDPDAIPTVVRWLRKNGIKCEDKILTCKAKGYGACNDYVPMPVVD